MATENLVETDILVIGGGMAGCFAAIKAREKGVNVTLVEKGNVGTAGSSPFAAHLMVFNKEWGHDFDAWMEEFNFRGEYLNNRMWTEFVVGESLNVYNDFQKWGVEIMKEPNGEVHKWKYPNMIVEGTTLRRFRAMPVIRKQVLKTGVKIFDRIMITDLLTNKGSVVGALGMAVDSYDIYIFQAKAVVMSTGAASFRPPGWPISNLTADGEAMAYRIGGEIGNKEFVDAHEVDLEYPGLTFGMWQERATAPGNPDVVPPPGGVAPLSLHYNAEGVELINPRAGSYTLDRVFQAHAGHAPLYQKTPKRGLIAISAGATAGAANHNGEGIFPLNDKCASNIPGLFAAGDSCAISGIGAVYTASGFALQNAAVSGTHAGMGAAEYAKKADKPVINKKEVSELKNILFTPKERTGGFSPRWVTQVLQNLMIPYYVLFIKDGKRLKAALTMVEFMRDELAPKLLAKDPHELRLAFETKNLLYNAEAKLKSALYRTESRGSHYREDYPQREDPKWLAWVTIQKDESGNMKLKKRQIPKKWWPDLSKPYAERYPWRFPKEVVPSSKR